MVDKNKVTCYFIFMLTQRTNVLFSPYEYNELVALTAKSGQTMGELIRQAVRKTYKIKVAPAQKKENSFQATMRRIRKLTKNVDMSGINYRELVTEGRKYE